MLTSDCQPELVNTSNCLSDNLDLKEIKTLCSLYDKVHFRYISAWDNDILIKSKNTPVKCSSDKLLTLGHFLNSFSWQWKCDLNFPNQNWNPDHMFHLWNSWRCSLNRQERLQTSYCFLAVQFPHPHIHCLMSGKSSSGDTLKGVDCDKWKQLWLDQTCWTPREFHPKFFRCPPTILERISQAQMQSITIEPVNTNFAASIYLSKNLFKHGQQDFYYIISKPKLLKKFLRP
jgi:hypothetical protein